DITVDKTVAPAGLAHRFAQGGTRHRQLQQDRLGGILESFEVFLQPEDALLIETNSLKDAVPVKESVIEDRDLRIRRVNKRSVEINLHGWPRSKVAPQTLSSHEAGRARRRGDAAAESTRAWTALRGREHPDGGSPDAARRGPSSSAAEVEVGRENA